MFLSKRSFNIFNIIIFLLLHESQFVIRWWTHGDGRKWQKLDGKICRLNRNLNCGEKYHEIKYMNKILKCIKYTELLSAKNNKYVTWIGPPVNEHCLKNMPRKKKADYQNQWPTYTFKNWPVPEYTYN